MTWDDYFLTVATAVATNSKCHSRQVGALLVRSKRIVCTGYNGPPAGTSHCDGPICPRHKAGYKSGEGIELCPAAHAERNCLITAARLGIQTLGCSMYMTCGVPCKECIIEIIQAGIKEVVVKELDFYDTLSIRLIREARLRVRIYNPRNLSTSIELF